MSSKLKLVLLVLLAFLLLKASAIAGTQREFVVIRKAPHINIKDTVNDGSVTQEGFHSHKDSLHAFNERNLHNSKVSVATVTWFTLAMAVATGLGAVPFFFVELEPQWAGICNGLAAGVMLAASFDLVQEGQTDGGGSWVVFGILAGGVFIWLCKKLLEQYGEVSMLDIKGADASKVILVVGIMTLHSFGEGSGVGVSFAGSKGLSQGLLVTLAIAVHNIPEGLAVSMVLSSRGVSPQNAMLWSVITSLPQPIVAVPAFLCADTFQKVLPFCTGFAAGCMIWMVIAEVLPDAFKEAAPFSCASSATIAVAFMETLGAVLQVLVVAIVQLCKGICIHAIITVCTWSFAWWDALVMFALALCLQHAVLSGIASGIALLLAAWRPLQLLVTMKMGFFTIIFLLAAGASFFHVSTSSILKLKHHRKTSINGLSTPTYLSISLSVLTLQSFFACGAILCTLWLKDLLLAWLLQGLWLGPSHGPTSVSTCLPRGAAVASCIFGATDSWRAALAAATLTGFAGPIAAVGAIVAGIDYSGLDYWMVFACGALLPGFGSILRRAVRLSLAKSVYGFVIGVAFAGVCLVSTKVVCLHTPYCNSAPEAVR